MRIKKSREKMSKKKILIIIGIALIVLIGIVFGIINIIKITNKDDNKVTQPQEKEKEPEEPVKIIDLDSDTRPYAVMINCKSEALPQSGLQDAYMVYEETVEGGITRMIAFFKDKDVGKIGSVRSARIQFLPFVHEHDAIYVYSGGAYVTLKQISTERINSIGVDGPYGVRDSELAKVRAWEHTLFTNTSLLTKATNDYGFRKTSTQKPVLNYQAKEVDLSEYKTEEAKNISIKYSYYRTANYTYDPESKTYLRFMNEAKNTDLVTGKQYQVKNILIYGVQYNARAYDTHTYSDPQIYGTGDGYYVTNGVALPITWEKKDEKSQTVYKVKETGEELIVNDGNTYVQIYPTNGGVLTIK